MSTEKLSIAEIERAHEENRQETLALEEHRRLVANAPKDKKSVKGRMDKILENPLVKVKVLDRNIPTGELRGAGCPGLVEVKVHGTHLSLIGPADPQAELTMEQRVAMAKRLLEVGPYLPRYVSHARWAGPVPSAGITEEDVAESAAIAKDRAEARVKTEGLNSATFTPAPSSKPARPSVTDRDVRASDLMPKTQREAGILQKISLKGVSDGTCVALAEGRTTITQGSLRRKALELIKVAGGRMTIGALTPKLGSPAKPVVAKLLESGWLTIVADAAPKAKLAPGAEKARAEARAVEKDQREHEAKVRRASSKASKPKSKGKRKSK